MEKTVPLLVYDAVLLDIDGTLVDSNAAHAAAWSDAFAAHGRHHPREQVRPLIGKGGDKLLRELASLDDESGEGKRIAEARVEIFRDRSTCRPSSPRPARPRSSSGSWKAA
jgi:beta-phosphoglucomutase-like phosphatase (HAD superfamily)